MVINTLLVLPLSRSFLPPLLPYVLSNYPLLLPLLSTILAPVLLAQTSRIPLRSSIFQLSSSGLLSFGLLPQPLLPYSLCKMALYRTFFIGLAAAYGFFFTVSFCFCRNLHIALSLNLTPVLSCQYSQYSEAYVIWMFYYHLFDLFFLTKELARFPPFCLTRE